MMKSITFFKTSLSSGGAEHQLTTLANELVLRGYDVDIVTFADLEDHYKVDERVRRIRLAKGRSKFLKYAAIWLYFLRVKTDVIINFGQRESLILLPSLFLRPRISVIAGERNCTVGDSTKKEKLLFNILYRRANWIVPNSYSQAKHIISANNQLIDKIIVITNYTDINEFKVLPPIPTGKVRIGVFSRYAPQKNYERFLEAIAILVNEGLHNFEVHWFGSKKKLDSVNPHFTHFVDLVEKNKLQTIVYAHDSIKNVAETIPQFDLLCLPSLYEGFSNSLSEYICCGRPVLASDVSDNSLMVHDGENGFLFDPNSVESIVNAFKRFFSLKTDEQLKMGKNSRLIAETLFDKERFVNSYVSLIERLS